VFPAVAGGPLREGSCLLSDEEDHLIKILILSVADHHGPHVLFSVGLMVVAGPDERFFVFFDFVLMIILDK
jgi:hypothetical protein